MLSHSLKALSEEYKLLRAHAGRGSLLSEIDEVWGESLGDTCGYYQECIDLDVLPVLRLYKSKKGPTIQTQCARIVGYLKVAAVRITLKLSLTF